MPEKQRFTYLIGAGASYNRLPVVKNLVKGLEYTYNLFTDRTGIITSRDSITLNNNLDQENILKDLRWLIKETKGHATIDTFAKKLFLTEGIEGKNYIKLKHLLRFIFIIWHFKKEVISAISEETTECSFDVDPRYDAFFSNIIDKDLQGHGSNSIDGSISIISWNYDYQIEYSLKKFFSKEDMFAILSPTASNVFPKTISFNKLSLNGTLSDEFDNLLCENIAVAQNGDINFQQKLIQKYYAEYKNAIDNNITDTAISYAWEDSGKVAETRKISKQLLSMTDYLIIIGYSFPNFNRKIDKNILSTINPELKVIIQCPKDDFEQTRERFLSRLSFPTDDEIAKIKKYTKHIADTNEFHIHRKI